MWETVILVIEGLLPRPLRRLLRLVLRAVACLILPCACIADALAVRICLTFRALDRWQWHVAMVITAALVSLTMHTGVMMGSWPLHARTALLPAVFKPFDADDDDIILSMTVEVSSTLTSALHGVMQSCIIFNTSMAVLMRCALSVFISMPVLSTTITVLTLGVFS